MRASDNAEPWQPQRREDWDGSCFALAALAGARRCSPANSASAGPTATRTRLRARAKSSRSRPRSPTKQATWSTSRILRDLRWIAARFPIYVTDGYSGPLPDGEHVGCNQLPHQRLRPLQRPRGRPRAAERHQRQMRRHLERRSPASPLWAEPVQNEPVAALPLGRLRRRRRPRLRQPPPPLLEPRPAPNSSSPNGSKSSRTGPAGGRQPPQAAAELAAAEAAAPGLPAASAQVHSGGVSPRGD